ncbi:MAG: hypothetical protein ACK47B_22450 [Armatimonadota bacterium]
MDEEQGQAQEGHGAPEGERRFSQAEVDALLRERDQELEAARSELAAREQEALRSAAAARHRLPAELAGRLVGASEAELEADAQSLARLVSAGGQSSAANPPGGRSSALSLEAVRKMSPAEINARWEDVRGVLAGR